MKKILIIAIAMLLVAPLFVSAASCDSSKSLCVVAGQETDENFRQSTDEGTGVTTKSFPIYVEQPGSVEIKDITVNVTQKSSSITEPITFAKADPYVVTSNGDTATFSLPEGVTGKSDRKVLIGYVVITVNNAADDCSFTVQGRANGVKTGAFANYIAMGAGALLVAGIYVAVRSKKKMYNI